MAGRDSYSRADRSYVSAFLTNHIIPEAPEDVQQFTLQGAGYGWWETQGNAVSLAAADLFLVIHWVGAQRGAYTIEIDIRDTAGTPIAEPFFNKIVEIPSPHHVYTFNVPLTGLVIPAGMHYLWVCVEGVLKAPVVLRVFGPDEPPSG